MLRYLLRRLAAIFIAASMALGFNAASAFAGGAGPITCGANTAGTATHRGATFGYAEFATGLVLDNVFYTDAYGRRIETKATDITKSTTRNGKVLTYTGTANVCITQ
ncbi:MAG: hypothetical protein ABIS59_01540, partial [Candidatus Saccharibacteria bacterium]